MKYNACRFICSVHWRRLVEIQLAADEKGVAVQFVVPGIDPEQESPALWREYRLARGLTRDNRHFLTGTRSMTTRAAALLGERWWFDEGHLLRDFRIVRLDTECRAAVTRDDYARPAAELLR